MLDWLKEADMAARLESAIAAKLQSGSDRHRGRQSPRRPNHSRRHPNWCAVISNVVEKSLTIL
ncbi:MAG: hypothetical protein DME59_15300 [Verrucomicrobia bacterium]|nr:MAG: hypothetical protein DME59_15300 [Verrucomicrobiota bacterium]